MPSVSELLQLLKIDHPIIQAPMVGVSTPELAAAVSNAGALGSLGLGACTLPQARQMIADTRALTDKPFNVNFFCHRPAMPDPVRESRWLDRWQASFNAFGAKPPAALREIYQSFIASGEVLDMLLNERPAVVSFHFGLPPVEWIGRLRQAGIVTLACATTPDEARQVEEAGIDAIIAQGAEAGGHRGIFIPEDGDAGFGTFALTRLIAAQSRLPVIATGGIMDGQGISAAIELGAAAAQLGSAFILCPESSASAAYRQAIKKGNALKTGITSAISGRPARGIVNRMHVLEGLSDIPDYPIAYDAAKALHAAASANGSNDYAPHWAGQAFALAREMPARVLVETLVREAGGA